MVIDQSRAISATLPSKRTGDAFKAVVMRTDCPLSSHIASAGSCGSGAAIVDASVVLSPTLTETPTTTTQETAAVR
jgi:hypothetical protein